MACRKNMGERKNMEMKSHNNVNLTLSIFTLLYSLISGMEGGALLRAASY
jgi:hypothetical protein